MADGSRGADARRCPPTAAAAASGPRDARPAAPQEFASAPEEDCRKKRCVDRYDSSESSDSGVAVLSCTDCSGSSTSSDIADPGSPFSVASSHGEDSKMTPTQSAHHPPWSWTEEANLPPKRPADGKDAAFEKRSKLDEEKTKENNASSSSSPTCLSILVKTSRTNAQILPKENASLSNNYNNNNNVSKKAFGKKKVVAIAPKMQQGKITEYFKASAKAGQAKGKKTAGSSTGKSRKASPSVSSVPRKILPAPTKIPVTPATINNFINHPVTLTAVAFPPNLAYLHAKSPKPPDNIFVPQFAAIDNRCLNIIQPFNNFNSCVKLNATVVPIVKLPSRLNGSNFSVLNLSKQTIQQQQQQQQQPIPNLNQQQPAATPHQPVHQNVATTAPTSSSEALSETSSDTASSIDMSSSSILIPEGASSGSLLGPATPDSGISTSNNLEVSVSDEPVASSEAQKSPILSQPKTIRFPAKRQEPEGKEKRPHSGDKVACHWAKCQGLFDASGALLEHLQLVHVVSQTSQEEQYVCLWVGCKVHGRKSCSRSWLERHVLAHAGTKPFRCIVDGCGMRFNSQLSLERHVNNHFNTDGSQKDTGKKQLDSASAKLFKRNGKKLRFRRQPWSARMFDFIDSGIMEGLQHKLLTLTEKRTLGRFEGAPGDAVTLQSRVLARRIEADGAKQVLLRWHPRDILPDEWVHESKAEPRKHVSIPRLSPASKDELDPVLFGQEVDDTSRRRRRRKPCKPTTAT